MHDVVTIGTATRDVYITNESFKVLKDPKHLEKMGFDTGVAECFALGTKMDIERPAFTIGGGAINTAVSFSRLGLNAASSFKVGDDEFGDVLVRKVKDEKISPIVSRDKSVGTAYSTILLNPNGERTVLAYRGASNTIRKRDIVLKKLRARWAYIVSGHLPIALLKSIVEHLKKRGICIAFAPSQYHVDMGHKKLRVVLRHVDVVLMNREEAARFTKEDYKREKLIFRKLDEAVDGIAVMTEGSGGSLVSDGQFMYRAGVFKEKELIDRTGAGDAFGSGFVAGIMRGHDIPHALRLASANATSVVEKVGASTGSLTDREFKKKRWQYLDLDVEPL
ncbi:hypothetical protein CL629_01165 [bacterium]|nr:hypothetical protein [bacterium]